MRGTFAAIAAVFCVAGASAAHAQNKIKVAVEVTAKDAVGRQFAFHVRDQIGRSGMFVENNDGTLRVLLVTLDPDSDNGRAGVRTIYSYTIVISGGAENLDSYLTSGVGYCGASRVQSCASDVFSILGEQVETIRAALAANKGAHF